MCNIYFFIYKTFKEKVKVPIYTELYIIIIAKIKVFLRRDHKPFSHNPHE